MAYSFTNDWSNTHEGDWREILAPYMGQDGVVFLEIGTYEGQSACWFVDNILTGKDCRMVCIDAWKNYDDRPTDNMDEVFARFLSNISASTKPEAFTYFRAPFENVLVKGKADVVYIDGDHSAAAVLYDAVRAWRILKPGGLMMFDDYGWSPPPPREPKDGPGVAIDAFISVMRAGGHASLARQGSNLVVLRKEKD